MSYPPDAVLVAVERQEAAKKLARQEYSRRYYLANREKYLEAARRNRPDAETKRKQTAAWREANPEQLRVIRRRHRVKKKYGLTLDEYDAILARGCAICGVSCDEATMHLDHDHHNGKVRSALCQPCNHMLGHSHDDPVRLRAAAEYLERHRKDES